MGWSYAVAHNWLDNEEHRLPNIRLIDDACQGAFIRKFIALQDWSRPTMLVLGDSQPFNDRAPLETTWHFALAKDFGLHPVSMAVIDGRPEDSAYIAGPLLGRLHEPRIAAAPPVCQPRSTRRRSAIDARSSAEPQSSPPDANAARHVRRSAPSATTIRICSPPSNFLS
jgi:hypothetical protein